MTALLLAGAILAVPLIAGVGLAVRHNRREVAQAVVDREVALIQGQGFDPYVVRELENARVAGTRHGSAIVATERVRDWFRERRKAVRERVLGTSPLLGVCIGSLIFLFFWVIAFQTFVEQDRAMFLSIGHDAAGVELRSRALALFLSFLGFVLVDLLRPTHLIPGFHRIPRTWRLALAGSVFVFLILTLAQLPRVAEHRSDEIHHRVLDLEASRVALEARADVNPAAVSKLEAELEAERRRWETAKVTDRLLILGAAILEVGSSWSLAVTAGLLVLLATWLGYALAERRVASLRAENAERTQALFAGLVNRAVDAEVDIDTARSVITRELGVDAGEVLDTEPPDDEAPPVVVRSPLPPELEGGPGVGLSEPATSEAVTEELTPPLRQDGIQEAI